jgi:hypothetical protein
MEIELNAIERMVSQIHVAGLARSRDQSMANFSDEENANVMTHGVMDVMRRLMKLRGPLVFLALIAFYGCSWRHRTPSPHPAPVEPGTGISRKPPTGCLRAGNRAINSDRFRDGQCVDELGHAIREVCCVS